MKWRSFFYLFHVVAFWVLVSTISYKEVARWHRRAMRQDPYSLCDHLAVRHPVTENKPIAIVVTSYNNQAFCEKNLESIFNQTYSNYRVIYIDDCSTDATYTLVSDYIARRGMTDRVTLIRNPKRMMKTTNLYRGIHLCKDHEIVAVIDGDDWLSTDDALETINRFYQDSDVWITYGSTVTYPHMKQKPSIPVAPGLIKDRKARYGPFKACMLRTFYAGLFKMIPLRELSYKGDFLHASDDVAYMNAMFEMAPEHVRFCENVLYVINDSNPLRTTFQESKLEEAVHNALKNRPPVPLLPKYFSPLNTTTACMIRPLPLYILSTNGEEALKKTLSYYETLDTSIEEIYILSKKPLNQPSSHKNVTFISHEMLESVFAHSSHPYVLIASDDAIPPYYFDVRKGIEKLEQSQADSFFICLPKLSMHGRSIDDELSFAQTGTIAIQPELYKDQVTVLLKKEEAYTTLSAWYNHQSIAESLLHLEGLSFYHTEPNHL